MLALRGEASLSVGKKGVDLIILLRTTAADLSINGVNVL